MGTLVTNVDLAKMTIKSVPSICLQGLAYLALLLRLCPFRSTKKCEIHGTLRAD